MSELLDGELEVPNPGNRRCKLCGGLIMDATIIRYGCNIRHRGCSRGVVDRPRRTAKIVGRHHRRRLAHLFEEETPEEKS